MKTTYVVYSDLSKAIKIGYASNIGSRISAMQVSTAETLVLLFVFQGGLETETELHLLLNDYKLRGEWFSYNQYSLKLILDYQQTKLRELNLNFTTEDKLKIFIESQCDEYLAVQKTRKRTRVPLKFVRSCCSEVTVSLADIRTIMSDLGYKEYKDANNSVFFIKGE